MSFQALRLRDNELVVTSASDAITLPVSTTTRFVLTAFGKASIPMALAAERRLGQRIHDGVVIAPITSKARDTGLRSRVFYGAHNNLPDANSVAATMEALHTIQKNDADDVVFLFLISGGGSALFCAPDGISLEAKLSTIKTLTANGANIRVLNAFRQKLSAVKGGKTLNFVKKGMVVSLIVSDLIDDLIQFIASGPTILQTPTMVQMSQTIVTSSKWTSLLPPEIMEKVRESSLSTLPSSNPHNIIIASNSSALEELRAFFTSFGYDSRIVCSGLEGNATEVGRYFAEVISAGKNDLVTKLEKFGKAPETPLKNKVALLFGGETTVELHGDGRGGRCQEMALSCLISLSSSFVPLPPFLFLAAGTDGQDGPTDAAGALISNDDIKEDITKLGERFLNTSNSYQFWSTYNNGKNHIKTGPTGTNVMDIQIVLLHFEE
ncbi:Glycerate kinase [Trichostrongylus colubriformis]|uniref:Glycerate kinase n=1 Tax=Trichostrongylus colubriformis TaxID=6319 RepID=A0AAN8FB70_TRICO